MGKKSAQTNIDAQALTRPLNGAVSAPTAADAGRAHHRGLEQLRIGELLLVEAAAKLGRGEIMEARELREEAQARRHAGLAMLEEAKAPQRFYAKGA